MTKDYMLHHFADDTCQLYWSIVCWVGLVAVFVNCSDKSCFPGFGKLSRGV